MKGMKGVGFIVVSAFMVTHVDRDRCVKSWEDVVRACGTDRESVSVSKGERV